MLIFRANKVIKLTDDKKDTFCQKFFVRNLAEDKKSSPATTTFGSFETSRVLTTATNKIWPLLQPGNGEIKALSKAKLKLLRSHFPMPTIMTVDSLGILV